jgi:hypothetical protein
MMFTLHFVSIYFSFLGVIECLSLGLRTYPKSPDPGNAGEGKNKEKYLRGLRNCGGFFYYQTSQRQRLISLAHSGVMN